MERLEPRVRWRVGQSLAQHRSSLRFLDFQILFAVDKWSCHTVAGRKPILTSCWKLFDLFLLLWSHSMACQEDPAPLLNCKLKCLCSAHGDIVCLCHLWIEEIKEIAHPFWKLSFPLEMFCKTQERPFCFTSPLHLPLYSAFWLWFLIASFSLIYERTWLPDPKKMVILRPAGSPIKVSS